MAITFDTAGLQAKLSHLAQQLPELVAPAVREAGLSAVADTGYNSAGFDEQQTLDAEDLVSDVEIGDSAAIVTIVQLYDWILDPEAKHCSDPGGNDCPTFAANGPYTAETVPAQPGDGTTPCGGNCHCTLEPRSIDPIDLQDALETAGSALRVELAIAWEG